MKKTFIIISSVLIISLALAVLVKASENKKIKPLEKLEGKWTLDKMNKNKLQNKNTIMIEFNKQILSGTTGCNSFSTDYELSGNQIKISDQFRMTEKACEKPLMEQETQFIALLQSLKIYSIQGKKLILKNKEGKVLIFKR